MEGLYQNKYRVKSSRLKGWDYGADAYYFVTICTQNRIECLGEVLIDDGGVAFVALSEIGNIAVACWLAIPEHFPFVVLDAFIIMPNHIHGILQICKHPPKQDDKNQQIMNGRDAIHRVSEQCAKHDVSRNVKNSIHCVSNDAMDAGVHCDKRDAINRVSTGNTRNTGVGGVTGTYNPMLRQTLATVIRWFKGRASHECHQQNFGFHWQTRFYDRIIRNELVLHKIRAYIKNNPKMWYRDRNNSEGLLM